MDYKYIEQLMERYWNAETSLEEESILRTFFSQKDIPAEMEHLRPLFTDDAVGQTLDDDFDARIMQAIGEEHVVKAREVSLTQRLMPLFKAAAVVAIILTLGNAAQAPWEWGYEDPKAAMEALKADSLIMGDPVQAENLVDTAQITPQPTLPKY